MFRVFLLLSDVKLGNFEPLSIMEGLADVSSYFVNFRFSRKFVTHQTIVKRSVSSIS